jgi:hypothetical protein
MSNWRSEVRDNYTLTLEAFQAANTSLLDRVTSARPASLADTRSAFVGGISEDIDLDSGTWRRQVSVDILCAIHLSDNEETTDKLEELADALVEWLAADDRAHVLGAHTEQHPVRSASVEISDGGIIVPAVAISCRASIQQGRT